MRSVEFHPEAQNEFISTAQFYERETEGLGLDFVTTIPYGLLYRVEPERIGRCVARQRHLHDER